MIRKWLSLFLFVFLTVQGWTQTLFKDPANFSNDVNTLMSTAKTEAATNAGNGITSVYGSASDAVKKKIFDITQYFYQKKKYKAVNYIDFYLAIYAAKSKKNLADSDLDSLLYMTQKVQEKYSSKQFSTFFITIKNLFEQDAIYYSSFNSLYVKGGTYKFRFIEAAPDPADKYDEMMSLDSITKEQDEQFNDLETVTVEEEANWGTLEDQPEEDQATEDANILDVGYLAPLQPAVDGAVIIFENVDLTFKTPYETVDLKGTSGALRLQDNVFVGKGGKVDWSMAGIEPDKITAELKEYNFPIISARLYSEGAVLTYPEKIDKPVDGIFEYKSIRHKGPEDASYPRFKSFVSNVDVKDLGENIDYTGGISLSGRKIYSNSIDEGYSFIKIKDQDTVVIKARAPRFELGDSIISAHVANMVIYMNDGKDSIFHPGVDLKFNKSMKKLRAVKAASFKHAPFLDSYHKIDMSLDGVVWDLDKPEINLSIFNGKNEIEAVFESERYYQEDKYSLMQGIYRFHPLQMLMGYSDRHKKDSGVFNVQDISKETNIDINSTRGAMSQLMKAGFIDYNSKTGIVKLRPRAKHYVLARRNKSDYDNIILHSLTPSGSNATLYLHSNELVVRGVSKVFLSDSLRVFILPDSNTVRFLENRNFNFNGKINTENFQFVGSEFEFNYDSFLVRLKHIEEIKVAVTERKDKAKDGKSRVLGNELKYTSGTLYINKPDNKSSRKKLPEYPIFDANSGATVFFTKNHINGGAYDTTIQFKIPPFRIDSLSGDDSKAIGFDGEFKSGGIFPEFKEKLRVMADYSLGFEHNVPKDGYPLYGQKGRFYNKIRLDNQGIRGDGEIHYISTTAWSKDFIFYKDSVITIGTKVDTKAGTHKETSSPDVTFPDLQINEYAMRWLPYQDSMMLSNVKELFNLYKGTATLEGKSIITPSGMKGQGALFTRGSETESGNFSFELTRYTGRNAKFQILTENPDKPAVLCNDVRIDFDLDKSIAKFSPEVDGYASNTFPYLQYKSSLDEGVWDLEKKEILMKMDDGGDINKSFFYSTHPNQDSLVFNATQGVYDMTSQTLKIDGVPYLKVADGKIFPDSNKVVIHENAVMETLHKAKILIDTVNEYHHLYDGTLDVLGRKKFTGEATYQYVNLGDDTLSIKFQDFRLQESLKKKGKASTVATGVVKEEDSLSIDQGVLFKGKVTMYADNKILFFDGYVQLVLKGALHYSQWMKYVNNGDRAEVVIDVTDPKADNGTPLFTGLHFSSYDSVKLYTTFISQKKSPKDVDIFTCKGIMNRNSETGIYTVSPLEKTEKKTLAGNVFVYNDSTSLIEYSGKFNFTNPEDKNFNVITVGSGNADLNKSEYNFNTFQTFTCKSAAAAFTAIGQNLKSAAASIQDTIAPSEEDYEQWDKKKQLLPYRLAEIIGDKGVEGYKAMGSVGNVPLSTVASDFSKAIVISDADFKWNHEFNAWYSVGKIKVSNFLKEEINKSMDGYIEIRKAGDRDVVNIYLEPTPSSWYYISYDNNRLGIITSSDETNTLVAKKAAKVEPETREKFYYILGTAMEKAQFVKFFEENYLGKIQEEVTFEQHEQDQIEVPDAELENQPEDSTDTQQEDQENKSPYPYEEKLKYEKKEGTKIEEPELNREKKEHTVEEKKELQQDQQRLKNLFK